MAPVNHIEPLVVDLQIAMQGCDSNCALLVMQYLGNGLEQCRKATGEQTEKIIEDAK